MNDQPDSPLPIRHVIHMLRALLEGGPLAFKKRSVFERNFLEGTARITMSGKCEALTTAQGKVLIGMYSKHVLGEMLGHVIGAKGKKAKPEGDKLTQTIAQLNDDARQRDAGEAPESTPGISYPAATMVAFTENETDVLLSILGRPDHTAPKTAARLWQRISDALIAYHTSNRESVELIGPATLDPRQRPKLPRPFKAVMVEDGKTVTHLMREWSVRMVSMVVTGTQRDGEVQEGLYELTSTRGEKLFFASSAFLDMFGTESA